MNYYAFIDHFLISGDIGSGKTTVIAKLQGVEDPKKGAGLEYAYIDVRDEYRDGELTQMTFIPMNIFQRKATQLVVFRSYEIRSMDSGR